MNTIDKKSRNLFSYFLIFLSIFYQQYALSLNTVDTGFQLATNELRTIVAHNTCKKVWNTSSVNTHFVSTKTNMEWTNFYANKPSDIVVRDCSVSCSNLMKTGGYTSGIYSIDLDGAGPLAAMNVYCDLSNDGGGWTKVYNHYTAGGYFPTTASAKLYNQTTPTQNLYSILQYIDNLENLNRLTFKLYYPELGKRNIWSQFNNPIYDTRVMGYRGIAIDMKDQKWGGLEYGNGSYSPANSDSSLIDGSVEHSNWYYAIGSKSVYNGGIPGPYYGGAGVTQVELYVHDGGYRPMSCEHIVLLGESKGSGVYTIYPDQLNATNVYCEMNIDNGGWTLFYANAAASTMTDKRSYDNHLADLSGIPITSSNFSDANTVGMLDFEKFNSTQMMARDITNWGANDFSTVEFFNPKDFNSVVSLDFSPISTTVGDCRDLTGGLQFKFRNSNGASYYMDKALNWIGFGWGDCVASYSQTTGSDVHDAPRHYIYTANSAADSGRVRGVGGFNSGDPTVKGRYFLREKYDRPKNCMDILLNGKSKGNGTYTIYPEGNAVSVECDMTTQGGGWTKVWHGYPTHAAAGNTSSEVYSRSNSISFNQMRVEGVNTGFSIVDNTRKTAYLDKTIPQYYAQVIAQADAAYPQVKFADIDGVENIPLVSNNFFYGYGNNWRVFYSCINVDPTTADRIYIGGGYGKYCVPRTNFASSSISTCLTGANYCSNAYASTEADTTLGLTLKQYQETRVWVRSLPSMRSCREIKDQGYSSGDGIYIIDPDGPAGTEPQFLTFCDMATDGGGWTLTWSNTKNGTNKPVTGITMSTAINTLPRCSVANGTSSDFTGTCTSSYAAGVSSAPLSELERFNYFVGLKHWNNIAKGKDFQLLYKWSYNYGSGVDQEAIMNVKKFDPAQNYKLNIDSYTQIVGNIAPGIIGYHNGLSFSTVDADNDSHATVHCADTYSDSPFWYSSCWSGSINGGGELSESGYFNGAYWTSSAKQDGDQATAQGAGNGWFFVREKVSTARLKASCKEILEESPSSPSGIYTIDYLPGLGNNQVDVYCDMTTDGGGWTLVSFSNGTATASIPNNFFVANLNQQFAYDYTRANFSASINPEAFSRAVGSTDAMFVSPSYNGGAPIIDNGFGMWDYNNTKCTGPLYHTSRTAGCAGQNANDNHDSADAFNLAFNSGNEAIVPAYKATEVCYSGKGSCTFKFFLR